MTVKRTKDVVYIHKYEYREQREDGSWTDPEIRYHNPTASRAHALKRHSECRDVEFKLGSSFARNRGYSWKNCELVKRATVVTVTETKVKTNKKAG